MKQRRETKRKDTVHTGPREVQCPLCGHRFEPGQNLACEHCPKLFHTCGLVMCPNCSHEFPR